MKSFLRLSTGLPVALCVGGLLLTASGCDKSAPPATQVAAKVNSDEISVHQINYALAKLPGLTPDKTEEARREILGKLVEQQLAIQQATEKKLDRSPEVVAAMEATKREILARAYFSQVVASLPQPTADEVRKYYADHPELFAERRIYSLQEVAVPSGRVSLDQLRAVANNRPLGEVVSWLKKKEIPFNGNTGIRSAEQVPLNVLAQLHATPDGKTVVIETPPTVQIVRVAASQSAPIDEAGAEAQIRQFLLNQRAREAIAQNVRLLQEKAKIEYLGEFAAVNEAKPSATAAESGQPAAPEAAEQSHAQGGAAPPPANIGKGVAALK
jgi:EpsD family peptidyl-prolyl cis-trans isomerase